MCGIAGYIGKSNIDSLRIKRTLELMKNRGPDCQDLFSMQKDGINIFLLHSRLSIIDLDKRANQPMSIGGCTVVCNGEIYNYKELKKELQGKGAKFSTESDTEVLLRSYIEYGESCVERFEGMWSFAIYDKDKEKLFLSRDRFAEKPLYFFRTSDGVFFGSEVKFIKSLSGESLSVNYKHIFRYLVNGYKSLYKSGDTFFEGVEEVPYATNMVIKDDLRPALSQYWKPIFNPKPMAIDEAVEGFRAAMLEGIKIRLRSDVPLAFCLSGGVDSSGIVSIAAKCFNYDVATFSIIDRDERYNEYDNIKATIDDLGCRHTIIDIPQQEPFGRLESLVSYHDAPVYTISYYIHSFLSEAIAKAGYRVACSGTAADELVSGYYDHCNLYLYEMRKSPRYSQYLNEWKNGMGRFVRNPYLKDPELYFKNPSIRDHIYLNNEIFTDYLKTPFQEPFEETDFCDSPLRNRMMNEIFYESIPVILHEDDLNSMFYSIENRSPYLDSRLFDFSYTIPSEYLIQGGYAKHILREAVKGILNEKVRTDVQKKGFNASINSIIDFNDKKHRDYILVKSRIFDFVKRDKIEQLLQEKPPLSNSYSKFFFSFINAKIFLELNG